MHEEILERITQIEDEERNFEKAIALLQDLIKKDPACIEAYVHLAADFGIKNNFIQAEQYARNALRLDPSYGRARYYLACALRSQGKIDEAYIEMEEALVLIRKAAVKGTRAETNWKSFPLFGWNKHVEDDAIALRAWIIQRNIKENIKNIPKRIKSFLILRMLGESK